MKSLIVAISILTINPMFCFAAVQNYEVNKKVSKIEFKGKHSGNEFKGEFQEWNAKIAHDSQELKNSSIQVEIQTASAKTGDQVYDGTLPQPDWFDVAKHPTAVYKSESIVKNADGSFTSEGKLKIKDKSVPLNLNFKTDPADLSGATVKTSFSFDLDRFDFDLGKTSDAKAEWVDKNITVTVTLEANKT